MDARGEHISVWSAAVNRIAPLGSRLKIKTSGLTARLAPLAIECAEDLVLTIPHTFDSISATTHTSRDKALSICGDWLDALPGDRLELELDASTVTARSDEAALPPGSPDLVRALGGELAALGWDGVVWTYVTEHTNTTDAECQATTARIDHVAQALGVTAAQREIGADLHASLARSMPSRAWLRSRGDSVEPVVGLAWDRVEWRPIQSMLGGFYPALDGVEQVGKLARACEAQYATVELILGTGTAPAMRVSVRL